MNELTKDEAEAYMAELADFELDDAPLKNEQRISTYRWDAWLTS